MTTPSQARIAAVLATAPKWIAARRKSDGKRFFYIPGSTPGAVYMTAADGCTCPAAQRFSGPCKHSLAVQQHEARQTAQTQPSRRSATTLAPKCGEASCDDDAGRYGFCYFHKPRQVAA